MVPIGLSLILIGVLFMILGWVVDEMTHREKNAPVIMKIIGGLCIFIGGIFVLVLTFS